MGKRVSRHWSSPGAGEGIDHTQTAVILLYPGVPRPRLEVLCDVSLARARSSAAQLGFAGATDDWRALVEDSRVDNLAASTPLVSEVRSSTGPTPGSI